MAESIHSPNFLAVRKILAELNHSTCMFGWEFPTFSPANPYIYGSLKGSHNYHLSPHPVDMCYTSHKQPVNNHVSTNPTQCRTHCITGYILEAEITVESLIINS